MQAVVADHSSLVTVHSLYRMPKMCAIPQVVSDPLNPVKITIVETF